MCNIKLLPHVQNNQTLFLIFSDAKETHDKNVKMNITNATQVVEGKDGSIGIGFFASGFIILITGLLILCILIVFLIV